MSIEYRVAAEDAVAFVRAAYELGRTRRRDGARRWSLMQDLDDPGRFIERYQAVTWLDHLRQWQRATLADQEAREAVLRLHRGRSRRACGTCSAARRTTAPGDAGRASRPAGPPAEARGRPRPAGRRRSRTRRRPPEALNLAAPRPATGPLDPGPPHRHGPHIRSPQARHVRALEPDGEAVPPHRQGHQHRRQGGRHRSELEPGLRRCIQNARAVNMPKDKVEAAIKRASGKDAASFTVVIYEGYGPHGVAILVEAATDNPTRTVASVRHLFAKHGGNLATSGSVSFQFKEMGVFRLNPEGIDQDDLELYLIDHGLEEMGESTGEKGEPQLVIRCAFTDFGVLQKALEDRGIVPLSAEREFVCLTPTELPRSRPRKCSS